MDETPEAAPPPSRAKPAPAPRRIASHDLFAGNKEIVIVHDGRHYFLRITQNGKLILTA